MRGVLSTLKALWMAGMMGKAMFSFAFSACAIFWADARPAPQRVLITLVAVFSARTAGCLFNNLVDREFDAENPRTKDRPLANGALTPEVAVAAIALFVAVTVICAWTLGLQYVIMLPVPLALCFLYSVSKRFTWLCHFILGVACAAAPVGSWLVFAKRWELFPILLLGAMVAIWTAGYDILYATQDHDYDCARGLFSIPARFGREWAARLSACLHLITGALFFIWGWVMDFGLWYFLGTLSCCMILTAEHLLVRGGRYERARISFLLNQAVGTVMLVFTLLESLL